MAPRVHRAPAIRRTSTTTMTVWDGGKKYTRPVDLRDVTMRGHRSVGVWRKGAGVRT